MSTVSERLPALTGHDLYLFREGTHTRLYDKLGAHPDAGATRFAVWAPNAQSVAVVGDFNGWDPRANPMQQSGDATGIWQAAVPAAKHGSTYKYHIVSKHGNYRVDKADPYAFRAELPPRTGSVVWDLEYEWNDAEWMRKRKAQNALDAPWSIYEVHLGSWRRPPEEPGRLLSYREVAPQLAEYCKRMGFTHVELMPIMEHPFYGSWGYQSTGYFAPSSRYGTPQDFMHFVDYLHQNGIGVILDWVPSHFPTDAHGLAYFDGTHVFEHADARQGFHPDWKTHIFNYGRSEVRSFLMASGLFWLDKYHIDGLRVDAVASMLYLDYSRKAGEWIPNKFGGRENLDAIDFLRQFNTAVYARQPGIQTIAEESTAWPMVSRPTYVGGLGFGMKWDMGWMHDTLSYFSEDPVHRKYHHNQLSFLIVYAFTENFVLPLSHDEVVHGKGSLIGKMPGDEWQKFANLRLLYGYMFAQPGKKLLFMGDEFAQWDEWDHEQSLDWHLLDQPMHGGMRLWVGDLNRVLRDEKALHELDFDPSGFSWIDVTDADQSVVSLIRRGRSPQDVIVGVFNFTPVPRSNYQIGIPQAGRWLELLNSDAPLYGGSGQGNLGGVEAVPISMHGHRHSLTLTLPPLAALFLKPAPGEGG